MASEEEKRRLIAGYLASGKTRRAYCAEQGMAVSTLDYWRHRRKTGKPKLARVVIKDVIEGGLSGPGFSLTLGNGRRIESTWRFAETDLARLIRAAEA